MTRTIPLALVLSLLLAACGGDDATNDAAAPSAAAPWLLASEPAGVVSVTDAKAQPEGTEVVVLGRISKLLKGHVALTLTDDALDYCGRGKDCESKCTQPWDYCCIQKEAVMAGSLPVEMRDAAGHPMTAQANDLRLLDLVAISGTLQKTESGGLMLQVKDGIFRRERPTLPDWVVWP